MFDLEDLSLNIINAIIASLSGGGRVIRSAKGLVRGSRSYRSVPTLALNVSKSTWIIAVPSGQKIAAKFTRMKLSKVNSNQCDDYVEIKDGLFGMNQRSIILLIVATKAFE